VPAAVARATAEAATAAAAGPVPAAMMAAAAARFATATAVPALAAAVSARLVVIAAAAGIVAAVVPLNDQAVVPLMVDLHRQLRAGRTLAESVYSVRCGLAGDPVQLATAMSVIALGPA
jgi:hypothetical protein